MSLTGICFIFRPILVLKCDQGFVGYKSSASTKLECNKTNYETVHVERGDRGQVFFKGEAAGRQRNVLVLLVFPDI